jgi:HEAT repeats
VQSGEKQAIRERMIKMILSRNKVCAGMRRWMYLIAIVGIGGFAVWLPAAVRIDGSVMAKQSSQTKPDPQGLSPKQRSLINMAKNEAYDDLMKTFLTDPDPDIRWSAFNSLVFRGGKDAIGTLAKLYQQSRDPIIKEIIIHNLGNRKEIDSLTAIARTDPSPKYRQLATEVIKWLRESGDADLLKPRSDAPPPPPPPPPPRLASLQIDDPPPPRSDQIQSGQGFVLMRETVYAFMRRDPVILERILADDYFGTDESGAIYNKAQEITGVKRFDQTIRRFEFNNSVFLSGSQYMSVAGILGTAHFHADGKELIVKYRCHMTFAKRMGQLKVVGFHLKRQPS